MKKNLLTVSVQVITVLFAAFGGVLTEIAPPDQLGIGYTAGIASFLTLIVLLFITAFTGKSPSRRLWKVWLISGVLLFLVAASASIIYPQLLDAYTYPPDQRPELREVNASDQYLTPEARDFETTLQKQHLSAQDLVNNFPSAESVWTEAGMEKAKMELRLCYMGLVLSVSGAIFCLLEANKQRLRAEPPPRDDGAQ